MKSIIRKNLNEYHDLIRHDTSIDLLSKATDSLTDSVRYLELLEQELEHKECSDTLVKILGILRHPMGNVSNDGWDHKDHSNILAMLEMISSIVGREKYDRIDAIGDLNQY